MDRKPWYASKTVWGALIAIAAAIVGAIWQIDVPEEAQASAAELIVAVVSGVGGLIALVGRLVADTKIGK